MTFAQSCQRTDQRRQTCVAFDEWDNDEVPEMKREPVCRFDQRRHVQLFDYRRSARNILMMEEFYEPMKQANNVSILATIIQAFNFGSLIRGEVDQ